MIFPTLVEHLDKALCSYGMVPTRADRCYYVLYSTQSRERTRNQRNYTQWHDTSNISIKARVRTEADAAYEKILDPIAVSPATGNFRSWKKSFCR